MIARLLRRDAALQTKPLLVQVTSGFFVGNLILFRSYRIRGNEGETLGLAGGQDTILAATAVWLILILVTMIGRIQERGSYLDLGLPIPPRMLLVARSLALAISAAVLGACAILGVALTNFGIAARQIEVLATFQLYQAAQLPALTLLAASVWSFLWPERARVKWNGRILLLHLAVLAVMATVGTAMLPTGMSAVLIPAAAAAILLFFSFRMQVPSLVLEPRESDSGPENRAYDAWSERRDAGGPDRTRGSAASSMEVSATASAGGLLRARLILGTLFPIRLGWVFILLPFYAVYGALAGGVRFDLSLIQYLWLWALMCIIFMPPAINMYRIDPLPISRRRLLPVIVVPALFFALGGHVISGIIQDRDATGKDQVQVGEIEDEKCGTRPFVLVSGEHFRIAWDGNVPLSTSPWGEEHATWSAPILPGLPARVYTPYKTPAGSSAEFIALQWSRAIGDVYGVHIDPDELRERYLATDAAGRPHLRGGSVSLITDYPDLRPRPMAAILPIGGFLIAVPWLLLSAWILPWIFANPSEAGRRKVSLLLVVPPLIFTTLLVAAGINQTIELGDLKSAYLIISVGLVDRVPGGAWTLWIVTAAGVALAYKLLERRFLRVEVVPGGLS